MSREEVLAEIRQSGSFAVLNWSNNSSQPWFITE